MEIFARRIDCQPKLTVRVQNRNAVRSLQPNVAGQRLRWVMITVNDRNPVRVADNDGQNLIGFLFTKNPT